MEQMFCQKCACSKIADRPSEAQIETTHERDRLVNDTHLFMLSNSIGNCDVRLLDHRCLMKTHMSPIECSRLEVGWRPLNHNILMQIHQSLLCVTVRQLSISRQPMETPRLTCYLSALYDLIPLD